MLWTPCLDNDKGLTRVGRRIHKSGMPEETKYPVIVTHENRFVDLLIQEAHEKQLHAGTDQNLTHIRQAYWIIQGRSAVTKVVNQCRICRYFKATSVVQRWHLSGEERATPFTLFTHVGIYFLGSLFIKNEMKAYVCLFTCCATLAVHLEVAGNMTIESFLLALTRMMSRRGKICPSEWSVDQSPLSTC